MTIQLQNQCEAKQIFVNITLAHIAGRRPSKSAQCHAELVSASEQPSQPLEAAEALILIFVDGNRNSSK